LIFIESVKKLLNGLKLKPSDFTAAVFHQPNVKFPQKVAKMLGFTKDQIKEKKIQEFKRSVAAVEQAALKIDQAVKRKIEIEKKMEDSFDPFSYRHISNKYQVESEVFTILNNYENLCYQTINQLLSKDAWFQIRGDAFKKTMSQYESYINDYIEKTGSENAWLSCRKIYEQSS